MSELIMKRTEVMCPNCMSKNVIQETKDSAYCDGCGTQYHKQENSNSLKFK